MSVEFTPETLFAKKAVAPEGTYRMIEVDGFWSVFYEGVSVRLIGTSMDEIGAMKLIDVHMRIEREKAAELKKTCNCGGKCNNTKGC